jgi:hypothetical protein
LEMEGESVCPLHFKTAAAEIKLPDEAGSKI